MSDTIFDHLYEVALTPYQAVMKDRKETERALRKRRTWKSRPKMTGEEPPEEVKTAMLTFAKKWQKAIRGLDNVLEYVSAVHAAAKKASYYYNDEIGDMVSQDSAKDARLFREASADIVANIRKADQAWKPLYELITEGVDEFSKVLSYFGVRSPRDLGLKSPPRKPKENHSGKFNEDLLAEIEALSDTKKFERVFGKGVLAVHALKNTARVPELERHFVLEMLKKAVLPFYKDGARVFYSTIESLKSRAAEITRRKWEKMRYEDITPEEHALINEILRNAL